ncbi:MAG TPA: hypothetical protein VIQ30_25245 [Pseudonocardia sp.]
METYSFDVEVSTHELLRDGVVATKLLGSSESHHRVVVVAESVNEAGLIAQQMASCHGMCTGVYLRV